MTSNRPPVVFIGPMGAGKTRLGKRVARLLGVGFTDTDKVIVAEHGPIADLFVEFGEPYFRALERDAVLSALASGDVVSLGGGAVLDDATQSALADQTVILLTTRADAVAARIADGKRPLVKDGVESWQRIYDERRALYERLATHEIDTAHRNLDEVAGEVVAWLEQR